jgi:antitoxin (DNA-binding transcriptional repressor) of toxin-antitoxin stability system
MSQHSVADAETQLDALIDRALAGEGIVITRHGMPVAELKVLPDRPRRVTAEDLDWLAANRVGGSSPVVNAGDLVSSMRDDDDR